MKVLFCCHIDCYHYCCYYYYIPYCRIKIKHENNDMAMCYVDFSITKKSI